MPACKTGTATTLESSRRAVVDSSDVSISSFRVGLAAGRVDGKRVTWSAEFGWADLENKVAMTPESILNIASVSKTFTATAAMQLWEAGKLDLGDTDRF